jgi:hypothetical protein
VRVERKDAKPSGQAGSDAPEAAQSATLRADELNLFDSTVVAVSSVAPAYSLAATLSLLFAAVGVAYAGPAVIIVSFVPVLFIAVAYFYLNRRVNRRWAQLREVGHRHLQGDLRPTGQGEGTWCGRSTTA